MKNVNRLVLVGSVCTLLVVWLTLGSAKAESDIELEADVTAVGGSGVFGNATVDIDDEGLHGKLKVHNLVPGHGYTAWLFYIHGTTGGPGRFDSAVADTGDVVFRGHVGGLQVSSGATIRLLIFDHSNLTALPSNSCLGGPATDVARANNLLTPQCGAAVGKAEFVVP